MDDMFRPRVSCGNQERVGLHGLWWIGFRDVLFVIPFSADTGWGYVKYWTFSAPACSLIHAVPSAYLQEVKSQRRMMLATSLVCACVDESTMHGDI